jgi:FMN reductase
MALILGVNCSLRQNANTPFLVKAALESAGQMGAKIRLMDLRDTPLPMYEAHLDYGNDPNVDAMVNLVNEADGYIVGTPEYHGCMSGAAKNFFDFLYREIAGKVFGFVSATGGSQGVSCFDNLRAAALYCHAWSIPYNVAATHRDVDENGNITNARVKDRLVRLGRDVAVYAPLLSGQFNNDKKQSADAPPGFAQWMA